MLWEKIYLKEFLIAGNKVSRQVIFGIICLPKHKILVFGKFSMNVTTIFKIIQSIPAIAIFSHFFKALYKYA